MQTKSVGTNGPRPPRSESRHHHRRITDGAADSKNRSNCRQRQTLAGEQAPDAGCRVADGPEQTHLAGPLLDAEPEEQRREQEGGNHEKEAEVGEVLAEVGRTARRGQSVRPHVANGQSGGERIDRRTQSCDDWVAKLARPYVTCWEDTRRE